MSIFEKHADFISHNTGNQQLRVGGIDLYRLAGIIQRCLGNRNSAVIFTAQATANLTYTDWPRAGNHTKWQMALPGRAIPEQGVFATGAEHPARYARALQAMRHHTPPHRAAEQNDVTANKFGVCLQGLQDDQATETVAHQVDPFITLLADKSGKLLRIVCSSVLERER